MGKLGVVLTAETPRRRGGTQRGIFCGERRGGERNLIQRAQRLQMVDGFEEGIGKR